VALSFLREGTLPYVAGAPNYGKRMRVDESSSVKPTIEAERVPNFLALAKAFQGDHDFALWKDFSQRTDKALRRKLFEMSRTFIPKAREYPIEFKKVCKPLGIKGANIEAMAVRFLFGTALHKTSVHDWSYVVRYWLECSDEQDAEKPQKRPSRN